MCLQQRKQPATLLLEYQHWIWRSHSAHYCCPGADFSLFRRRKEDFHVVVLCCYLALQLRNSFSKLSLGGLGQLTVDALWTTLHPALLVLSLQETKSQNYSEQLLWTVQFRNDRFSSQGTFGRLELTNCVISTLCMDPSTSTCFSMKAFVFVSLLCVYLIVFFSWCVWWTRLCALADLHWRRAELQQSGLNLHNTGEM